LVWQRASKVDERLVQMFSFQQASDLFVKRMTIVGIMSEQSVPSCDAKTATNHIYCGMFVLQRVNRGSIQMPCLSGMSVDGMLFMCPDLRDVLQDRGLLPNWTLPMCVPAATTNTVQPVRHQLHDGHVCVRLSRYLYTCFN